MKRGITRAATLAIQASVILLLWTTYSPAQEEYEPGPDNKFNTNLAFVTTAPLNPTAKFASVGWGVVYGAGYNFNRHNALLGEIMWNRLSPTSGVLAPIRLALQTPNVSGHGNLVALTANYRLQFQGKVFGAYLIGGGGMYYRNASLSQQVAVGNSVTCTPEWLWWGFTCSTGVVTTNQTLASSSSIAPGVNGGIGFTVRISNSWYKFYVESRYHYAPNKFVNTEVMPISVGIRF